MSRDERDASASAPARRLGRARRVGSTGARFPQAVDEPENGPDPAPRTAVPDDAGAGVAGGVGARFGGATRRSRREAARIAAQDAAAPAQAPRVPRPDLPAPDESPTVVLDLAAFVPTADDPAPDEDTRTRVRPYVRTGGRTRTRIALDVATLVSLTRPRPHITDPEHLAVEQVCDGPRSVAEVAALLAVPLGVARVLIDDMTVAGSLRVHPTAQGDGAAPAQDFMQRVLDGLRRL